MNIVCDCGKHCKLCSSSKSFRDGIFKGYNFFSCPRNMALINKDCGCGKQIVINKPATREEIDVWKVKLFDPKMTGGNCDECD